MADATDTAQSQQAKPKTFIGKMLGLPLTVFGILCASLVLSILVEILGMHLFWKDQGYKHAQNMFYYEVQQFSQTYTESILISEPVEKVGWLLNQAYEWLFIRTGLTEQAKAIVTPTDMDSARKLRFREYVALAYGYIQDDVLAAAYTTLTFMVRTLVIMFSLPLMLLAIIVGLIDGLVKRDIRRMTAGYESGFIYHRARTFLIPFLVLPWMAYLAMPWSISPILVLLPGAMLLGTAVNITAASFKRYL
ncbi:TIGR03747 family integrating conjugative element membrane protein [Saezia sanguinis]|uniref:TIGR03747 family integrating conjugative element membrane protein n=1 Tax=Saezia sanguinis TaxID=1965230 RepID=UPI003070A11E